MIDIINNILLRIAKISLSSVDYPLGSDGGGGGDGDEDDAGPRSRSKSLRGESSFTSCVSIHPQPASKRVSVCTNGKLWTEVPTRLVLSSGSNSCNSTLVNKGERVVVKRRRRKAPVMVTMAGPPGWLRSCRSRSALLETRIESRAAASRTCSQTRR